MKLKYLVTGTGRCGTVYLARCLTMWGIPCGHETIFDYDGISGARMKLEGKREIRLSIASTSAHGIHQWVDPHSIVADSSYMAAPFLEDEILADAKVIHVVRNPTRVVHSFVNHIDYFKGKDQPSTYETFIFRNIGVAAITDEQLTPYDRACLYYVAWNEMIEPHSDIFIRIEDSMNPLKDFLGVDAAEEEFADRQANTFKKPVENHFDVSHIKDKDIRDRFVAIGERYGYNMTSKYLLI